MWSSQLTSPNGSLSHWVYHLTGRRYFWIATPVVSMIQSEKNRMHPEVHEHIDFSILYVYIYICIFWKHWRPEPAVNLVYNSKKIWESPNLQVSPLPLPKEMKLDSHEQATDEWGTKTHNAASKMASPTDLCQRLWCWPNLPTSNQPPNQSMVAVTLPVTNPAPVFGPRPVTSNG